MKKDAQKTTVLGAGSWGTALAAILAKNGHQTVLWARSEAAAKEIREHSTNEKYLPGEALPKNLSATSDLKEALQGAVAAVFAVPTQEIRGIARKAALFLKPGALIIHAAKGLELGTHKRVSEIMEEEMPLFAGKIVALTGPSHAEEAVRSLPTTVAAASQSRENTEKAQELFSNGRFRVYTNDDIAGAEFGGALKNVIALGAGISDGLGYGDNAKAAILTRGLAEIGRLGAKLGANPLTFAGLTGMGDLVVTATSKHSRNWKTGYLIGQGKSPEEAVAEIGMVVEGVKTAIAVCELAESLGVAMPIAREIQNVMRFGKSPKQAVDDLMGRERKAEIELS